MPYHVELFILIIFQIFNRNQLLLKLDTTICQVLTCVNAELKFPVLGTYNSAGLDADSSLGGGSAVTFASPDVAPGPAAVAGMSPCFPIGAVTTGVDFMKQFRPKLAEKSLNLQNFKI
jgi:hypothetical protein